MKGMPSGGTAARSSRDQDCSGLSCGEKTSRCGKELSKFRPETSRTNSRFPAAMIDSVKELAAEADMDDERSMRAVVCATSDAKRPLKSTSQELRRRAAIAAAAAARARRLI